MKKSVALALLVSLTLVVSTPGYASDDSAPVVVSSNFSPSSVDLTDANGEIEFTLSATDETGVKQAAILCFTSNNVRSLYLDIRPGADLSSTIARNSFDGAALRIVDYKGSPKNFTITVKAPLLKGLFPGKHGCYTDIYDTVGTPGYWKNYTLAGFTTTRGGVGTPTPTPTPTATPTPTPTPTPEVVQRTLGAFAVGATSLTAAQRAQIGAAVRLTPDGGKFVCTGIRLQSAPVSENIIVRGRAKAACDFAKQINPSLSTWFQTRSTSARTYAGKVLVTVSTQ